MGDTNLECQQGAVRVHAKLPPDRLFLTAVVAMLVQQHLQMMHLRHTVRLTALRPLAHFQTLRQQEFITLHKGHTGAVREAHRAPLSSCTLDIITESRDATHQLATLALSQDGPVIQLLIRRWFRLPRLLGLPSRGSRTIPAHMCCRRCARCLLTAQHALQRAQQRPDAPCLMMFHHAKDTCADPCSTFAQQGRPCKFPCTCLAFAIGNPPDSD